jgi:ornithine carbamoyltransferase
MKSSKFAVYESLGDTAIVISRMVDVVMIRALKHETVTEFAEAATVPRRRVGSL